MRFLFPFGCRAFWGFVIALALGPWAWGGTIYGPLPNREGTISLPSQIPDQTNSGLTRTDGTLTLAGSNAYTGPVVIHGGTLLLNGGTSLGGGNLVLSGQNTNNGGLVAISGGVRSSPFKATSLSASIPTGPRPRVENTGKATGTGGGFLQLEDSGTGGTTISPGTLYYQGGVLSQVGLGEGTGTLLLNNTSSYGTLTLNPIYANVVPLTGGTLSISSVPSLVLFASATGGNLTSTNSWIPATLQFGSSPSFSAGTSLTVGSGESLILGGAPLSPVSSLSVSPVPEPGTLVLLAVAAATAYFWRRRRG
jgi:autotransporter-associated beta strand protein